MCSKKPRVFSRPVRVLYIRECRPRVLTGRQLLVMRLISQRSRCARAGKALHFTKQPQLLTGETHIPRPPFVARPPTPTGPRTNHQIRATQVRVLDADGQQIGVMSLEEAIHPAEEAGLDLIAVAASADPPVCRIADLGKFKFEQDKRARDSKKNQH